MNTGNLPENLGIKSQKLTKAEAIEAAKEAAKAECKKMGG